MSKNTDVSVLESGQRRKDKLRFKSHYGTCSNSDYLLVEFRNAGLHRGSIRAYVYMYTYMATYMFYIRVCTRICMYTYMYVFYTYMYT